MKSSCDNRVALENRLDYLNSNSEVLTSLNLVEPYLRENGIKIEHTNIAIYLEFPINFDFEHNKAIYSFNIPYLLVEENFYHKLPEEIESEELNKVRNFYNQSITGINKRESIFMKLKDLILTSRVIQREDNISYLQLKYSLRHLHKKARKPRPLGLG